MSDSDTVISSILEYSRPVYRPEEYPALGFQLAEWRDSRPLAGVRILDGTPLFANTLLKFVPLLGFLALPVGIFAVYAMVKLSCVLKHETNLTIIYAVCAFIPVVSLVALVLIVRQASAELTAAGYKVGLFGLSQADIDSMK